MPPLISALLAKTRRLTLALGAALVLPSGICAAQDAKQPFMSIVRPEGWSIPSHGGRIARGAFVRTGFPDGITFTNFAMAKKNRFSLPHYYVTTDGALVLLHLDFTAEWLMRLDVKGRPFAWVIPAFGVEVGVSAETWLVDVAGDGTFSQFWFGQPPPDLPDWVKKRLAALEPGGRLR